MNQLSADFAIDKNHILFPGDCLELLKKIPNDFIDLTITSPPYFMGKEYDTSSKTDFFIEKHEELLPEIIRVTKPGGSICWQVGHHVKNTILTPLDFLVHNIMDRFDNIFLRNRIIWTFGHGLHAKKRFSGRHETILWYTKGEQYFFDLDSVRIPQKYPGKKHYKGDKKGIFSGNPLGKNPCDVWDIPNVKSNHPEKTDHPCQFPIALAQRLIRAFSPVNGWILDPFIGSGTTGVASILEKRKFVSAEINKNYVEIAKTRFKEAQFNEIKYRPIDKPIYEPTPNLAVAQKPLNFK